MNKFNLKEHLLSDPVTYEHGTWSRMGDQMRVDLKPGRVELPEGFEYLNIVDMTYYSDQYTFWLKVKGWENKIVTTDNTGPSRDNPVDHPPHYTKHPSGVECIEITRHMNFNLGNALKYIWRADLKGKSIEDLEKAIWYLKDEIKRRGSSNGK